MGFANSPKAHTELRYYLLLILMVFEFLKGNNSKTKTETFEK